MPLLTLSATEAVANRKSNPGAGWGRRGERNRVEPVAAPRFEVPFRIAPGQSIFTIGSCFARNVEAELMARGFEIPVRRLFERPEFQGVELHAINNYGTPSILNELVWAFGDAPFDEAAHVVEVSPGMFADLHLSPNMRPAAIEVVRQRRAALTSATRLLPDCAALVMTLGLVEAWWDKSAGAYLNVRPRPGTLRQWPERFELHVLGFEECLDHLTRALDIVFAVARPDLRVILTVSPVPLTATHTADDVMVANAYSKAVLRAVAETIRRREPRVVYFPSYESVTLSDRKAAWEDDFIHVTAGVVSFNVGRMVAAFVEGGAAGEFATEAEAVEAARGARARSDTGFFETHGHWSGRSADFAVEHAGLVELTDLDRAIALLAEAPGRGEALVVARGRLLTAAGRGDEAIALLAPICRAGMTNLAAWEALLGAHAAVGDKVGLTEAADRWLGALPGRADIVHLRLSRALREMGDFAGARIGLERALAAKRGDRFHIRLELARLHKDAGDLEAARAVARLLRPETDAQATQLARLDRQLA